MFARVGDGAHLDAAFELRAVFDGYARGLEVALHAAGRTQGDALAAAEIALDGASNSDFARFDTGFDVAALTNRQP